jgi:tol-pal system protein YbgF
VIVRPLALVVVAVLSSAACASTSVRRAGREAPQLRAQISSLRAEREEQERTIGELRNRVFILEDRVDTQRVAISRQLPVVRLTPVGTPQEPPYEEPSLEEEPDAGPRPVLKLYERPAYGGGLAGGGVPRTPLRAMPAAALGPQDALPVVPMDGMPAPGSSGISAGTLARAPEPGAAESSTGDDASTTAIAAYEAAFALFRGRRFDEALAAFGTFVQQFPRHSYADNALYWRGECHYARRDFRAALAEFEAVLARYPDGNKAPDAMLKAALSRGELGDVARARAMLFRLAEQFPRSDAARLAQERAQRLGPVNSPGRPTVAGRPEVHP